MSRLTQHLDSICKWAKEQPETAWKSGPPPAPYITSIFYAVKTESGRVISGTGAAFCPANQRQLVWMKKYGPITHHIEVGD